MCYRIGARLTASNTSLRRLILLSRNGRVERLHRTIMGKARAVRLACTAPPSFTAAYLRNLTATSTLHGKTPLSFGTTGPSLCLISVKLAAAPSP
jgi:hypothetical protein